MVDEADRAFAREIRQTLTPQDIEATFRRIGMTPDPDLPLCDFVAPLDRPHTGGEGSTDLGDVSWVVPTVQARVATCAIGTPLHTWQQTAQGKAPAAHKGMAHAAKAMADLAATALADGALREAAKAEHAKRAAATPYRCPLPAEATPPISA